MEGKMGVRAASVQRVLAFEKRLVGFWWSALTTHHGSFKL